jgi:hypothetical protein
MSPVPRKRRQRAGSPKTPVPHTRAWLTLEQNLDNIDHMLALGRRELLLLNAATTRIHQRLGKRPDLTERTARTKLLRSLRRYTKTAQTRVERFGTATLWQVVILVTCVEAYLQDLLSSAASVDPELMNQSEQRAPYADVIAATSLEDLANDLRARWARNWLSRGGPTHWLNQFVKMGATRYADSLAPRLEQVWGIRHLVVHAAGVATPDFVKRHPGWVTAPGDRVKVSSRAFGIFLTAVQTFLEPTEAFFLARYPALLHLPATEPDAKKSKGST